MSLYPRKSSFALGVLKTSLSINPVFNNQSDIQQNALINTAVQRVCSLRNSLNKEDYQADTTNIGIGVQGALEELLALRVIDPNQQVSANALIVETNPLSAHLTYSYINSGQYSIFSDIPFFVDTNKVIATIIYGTEDEAYIIKAQTVSAYLLNVSIIAFQGGGFVDHNWRLDIVGTMPSGGGNTDYLRGGTGLWVDRPLTGVPIGFHWFATDQNSEFVWNGAIYV